MDEIIRCLEWSVRGLRIDIGAVPEDLEQMERWSQFWRGLRPMVECGQRPPLVQFVRSQYAFLFDSKSFAPEVGRLFSRWLVVDESFEQMRGQVWLGNTSSVASDGVLVMSARVRFDIPLAGPRAASSFAAVMKEDWRYVWDKGSLYGPESWAHQDGFACDWYGLRLLDQQHPVAEFGSGPDPLIML